MPLVRFRPLLTHYFPGFSSLPLPRQRLVANDFGRLISDEGLHVVPAITEYIRRIGKHNIESYSILLQSGASRRYHPAQSTPIAAS